MRYKGTIALLILFAIIPFLLEAKEIIAKANPGMLNTLEINPEVYKYYPYQDWETDEYILARMNPYVGGVVSSAAACSTPSTGDTLNEGFIGVGYEGSWTEGSTPDEDFTLSGSPPVGSCTEGFNANSSGATYQYAYWNNGSGLAYPVDVVAEVYLDTITNPTAFTAIRIITWDDDSNPATAPMGWVEIRNSSGSQYLRGRGSITSSDVAVSEDTWVTLKLHLDSTAASSYFQCTSGCADSAQKTFTRNGSNGQYLFIGYVRGDDSANQALDIEVGYIYVNTP